MENYPDIPLRDFPGIGTKRLQALARLGAHTAQSLLRIYPRAYQERGNIRKLSEAKPGEIGAFMVTVAEEPKTDLLKGRLNLTKVPVFDESGRATLLFFNQPYLRAAYRPGRTFRVWGKLTVRLGQRELTSPLTEAVTGGEPLPDLVPVYPLSAGLSQKILRETIAYALDKGCPAGLTEKLPEEVRRKRNLLSAKEAAEKIHRPKTRQDIEEARRTFAYEELYTFAAAVTEAKKHRKTGKAPGFSRTDLTAWEASLPFPLTGAQKRCIEEIRADVAGEEELIPMTRLVSGDVGCGKTMVAAAAALMCVQSGRQCALMAPTEILASQHYAQLSEWFEANGYPTALLTGSVLAPEKKRIKEALNRGEIRLVIGTHALITPDVTIPELGLVITDEQHRFGVAQRDRLGQKGNGMPHTLVMTATPIPRTLAMILYGDLAISRVDEMPPGRQKVGTVLVDSTYRQRLDAFIRKQIEQGGRVYIVCPAIEEEEDMESILPGAEEGDPPLLYAVPYAKAMQERLPELKVAVMHGKMVPKEKETIMQSFAKGETQVLVSTTVIEVGVNVPEATLMIVENAEHFGLSQLHQLRGRVGRGKKQSWCVLVTDSKNEQALERLSVLKEESDGFKIAEYDLKTRGPGDFFRAEEGAVRQSGDLRLELTEDNQELMKMAMEDAEMYGMCIINEDE